WKGFLLAASYVFYGYWDWRFLLLIGGSSVVNHAAAVAIAQSGSLRTRRALVTGAVIANLAVLGFFKYYGFFVVNAYALCGTLGMPCPFPLLDVVLPVGISFFTFQAMSYTIDVHRKVIPPAASHLDFALYLAFFPQLVAGPIVRASTLLPQIERPSPLARIDVGRATVLILGGLFKKIVVASALATRLVEPVFDNPELYGAADVMLAVYGYCVQIYCDFSAYSDIAIGVALLMGFHFPVNFDAPFFSASFQEFWRRWHISLSTWLRDYLFFPLGGSRGSEGRISCNLFLTFLLGGLWHGAGWNFMIWGALHGVFLIAERQIARIRGVARQTAAALSLPSRVLRAALVFHLLGFSLIFFRARTLDDAMTMLRALGDGRPATMATAPALVLLVVGFATQALDGNRARRLWDAWARRPAWVQGLAAAAILTVICALGPRGVAPFLYFQF
ncbi:MAG: MBOAT family protein, partial [Verrucomicrobia bacterium]|nr:MBOAT family protein [Verrucomicrobiota bacterium]